MDVISVISYVQNNNRCVVTHVKMFNFLYGRWLMLAVQLQN